MNTYLRKQYPLLFTNINFNKLLFANVLSEMGNQLQRFGIPWLIFHITHSGTLMALNFSLSLIPGIFFGFIGGFISDRVNRKQMLLCINMASFLLISMIMLLLQFESNISIIFIFILTFIISSLTSMYEPAFNASLPVIVEKKDLISMNSIFNLFESIIGLLGPAISGLIIGIFGAWMCVIINGISYLLSFIIILFIKSDLSASNSEHDSIKNDLLSVKNTLRKIDGSCLEYSLLLLFILPQEVLVVFYSTCFYTIFIYQVLCLDLRLFYLNSSPS